MDQLVRNAPFGTDFTPQPKWRLGKRNENYYSENRPTQGDNAFQQLVDQKLIQNIDDCANLEQQSSNEINCIEKVDSNKADFLSSNKIKFTHEDYDLTEKSSDKNVDDAISLEKLVNIKLQKRPVNKIKLKEIYKDICGYDHENTGLISENQLNLIVIKHELPLKVSTLRMLCHKFSDKDYSHLIHYEDFLKFLAKCIPSVKAEQVEFNNSFAFGSTDNSRSTISTRNELEDILQSYSVNEKFVMMLKEQMTGAECWNLEKLYEALLTADRYNEKQLKSDVILNICINQQVPLTKSLIMKLLRMAEIDHGNVNWRQFMAPIVKACTEINSDNPTEKSVSKWEEKVAKKSSPDFEAMRRNPVAPSFPNPTAKYAEYAYNMKRGATWSRNFAQLSLALKTYNPYKADRLPRKEVERMLCNYNVIYELGFPTIFMDNAVKKALVEDSVIDFEHTEIVSLDILLKLLAEKPA